MNKLKNCSECGRLYMEIGQGMCPDCFRKEQEMEQVVYSFVRDHDKCSIKEIVDGTGVKEKVVFRMLKAGRLHGERLVLRRATRQHHRQCTPKCDFLHV